MECLTVSPYSTCGQMVLVKFLRIFDVMFQILAVQDLSATIARSRWATCTEDSGGEKSGSK